MASLHVLSAGAAQSVVNQVIAAMTRDGGMAIAAEFGAVGAIKAKALDGVPADVLVLTDGMIDELIASGFLAPRRHDLGRVGTGVAVREGVVAPDVADAGALRDTLRLASKIVFPDPSIATAGRIVMKCLDELDLDGELAGRLRFFPNGNAAMTWLAKYGDAHTIGITQNTEILPVAGVRYVAPLPEEFQMKAMYAAGRVAKCANVAAAEGFIACLTAPAARPMLQAAGFEF